MINKGVTVVKLACVGCGATLDISQSMDRLACAHCGTQQAVFRGGGAIHLEAVADTLQRVQAGTDKAAAELALARLKGELDELNRWHSMEESGLLTQRAARTAFWNQKIKFRYQVLAGTILGIVFVFAIVSDAISKQSPAQSYTVQTAAIILIGLVLIAAAVLMYRFDTFGFRALSSERDMDLKWIGAELVTKQRQYNAQLQSLNERIEKNRQIANS